MSDPAQLQGADRGRAAAPGRARDRGHRHRRCWQQLEAAGVVRVIPTARAARLTMDREGIRRLAAETLGLPTSPYEFCDSLDELQAAIDARHRLPLHRQAGDEQLRQGPEQDRRPGRRAEGLGLRDGRRPREPRPRDRRGLHRLRLRDHAADRARARRRRRRCRRTSASRSATCRSAATTSRAGSRIRWRRPRCSGRSEIAQGRHRRPRRPGPLRRRAVRQGRRGLVQRGQPAPARHRHGDDGHAVAERVRAARARHPRPAGRHRAARARAPAP